MRNIAPGVVLCAAVTVLAVAAQLLEIALTGAAWLEALVLAILLGVLIRTVWTPPAAFRPGIVFSGKILLEIAVVLLGAAVSAGRVLALGWPLLLGILVLVAGSIGASYLICRALRLHGKLALLVACGNSICGNSAIAAVAPVIDASADDIAASIAFTAVLGVVTVLLLPLLVPLLNLTLTQYGVLAGLTVYAVPQVLAATLPIGALANQIGTVVKLVRVLMLGPVVFALSLLARRGGANTRLRLRQLVPWFIVGFLVLLALRSAGLIPAMLLAPLRETAALLTTLSMAALGLGTDVRAVARAGFPVSAAVTLSLVVLGGLSLGLIEILGV